MGCIILICQIVLQRKLIFSNEHNVDWLFHDLKKIFLNFAWPLITVNTSKNTSIPIILFKILDGLMFHTWGRRSGQLFPTIFLCNLYWWGIHYGWTNRRSSTCSWCSLCYHRGLHLNCYGLRRHTVGTTFCIGSGSSSFYLREFL